MASFSAAGNSLPRASPSKRFPGTLSRTISKSSTARTDGSALRTDSPTLLLHETSLSTHHKPWSSRAKCGTSRTKSRTSFAGCRGSSPLPGARLNPHVHSSSGTLPTCPASSLNSKTLATNSAPHPPPISQNSSPAPPVPTSTTPPPSSGSTKLSSSSAPSRPAPRSSGSQQTSSALSTSVSTVSVPAPPTWTTLTPSKSRASLAPSCRIPSATTSPDGSSAASPAKSKSPGTTFTTNTPWRKWFDTSQGSKTSSPRWLITQIDLLPLSGPDKSHLYDSLRVPLRWHLENSPLSRTRNTRPVREVFYHREPLLTRKDFSLTEELSRTPPKFTRLSRTQGEAVIDLIREVMLVRYRELYGTTLGDPRSVVRADLGRGVSVFLWNLPPERRLPLRAYTAGLTLKNGVPINYIEALALFEWMEVGFNTFYTFRGGEVAWTFAQVLRCLTHLMGTRCVSMYPYQLGYNNQEAIESGALWFYRKLGFRPGHPDLLRFIQREEQRIARDPKYRTPAATLRRLAAGHMFYELPGAQPGAWDRFSTRNLGLRAAGLMSRDFGGNLQHFRDASARRLSKILRIPPPNPAASLQPNPINPAATSFHNFAMLAALIPDLPAWTPAEKESLLEILRAKGAPSEMRYLHLLQTHSRLRDALLRLGSRT